MAAPFENLCIHAHEPSMCAKCRMNIIIEELHPWLKDLRLYANMLTGKIKLPHTIGECFHCSKARLRQIEYRESLQKLDDNDSNDVKEVFLGSIRRLKGE